MPIKYTENEIRECVRSALQQKPQQKPHFLYQKKFINYGGQTSDSRQSYSEVIANELLENYHQVEQIGTGIQIRRTKSFNASHTGIVNRDGPFSEKRLAIALYNSQFEYCFGKIFDYQIPLKERREDEFGEIDIVALAGNSIKLLELKIATKETLLRAVLEVYTYYKLIANSREKFVVDFKLDSRNRYYFQPGVLTDKASLSGRTLQSLGKFPYLREFILRINQEIETSLEFFIYDYPSQKVQFRSQTDHKIDLVESIHMEQVHV